MQIDSKISLTLAKKDIDDIVDPDFIEIARVVQGTMQTFVKETNYNLIRDAMDKTVLMMSLETIVLILLKSS